MRSAGAPFRTRTAPNGMVCSIDHLASDAGVHMIRIGGNAVDAAIAANAVLTVTAQHLCGMGGDLFALVYRDGDETPLALNASGRAGSGADPDRLRYEGATAMPMTGDARSVPVPGCVDGWIALHERCGSLDLETILQPAIGLAADGFGAAPTLVATLGDIAGVEGADDYVGGDLRPGDRVARPGVARELRGIATEGRRSFYEGRFGEALVALGDGEFTEADLAEPLADWVDPLAIEAWDHTVWTVPPNSQGYLTLASSAIASGLDLPDDPTDARWAHLLVEASRVAGYDRLDVLHERADGPTLIEAATARSGEIDPERRLTLGDRYGSGDTMFLCAADGDGLGVSLIQSNAKGWGCGLVAGDTGIFLHCRGIGFNLIEGHPGECRPGRRPAHTLAPTLVTGRDRSLRALVGTMGGDAQPQIVLQLLARLLHHGHSPAASIGAGRWVLASDRPTGFDTWQRPDEVIVHIEGHADEWDDGLAERGHPVDRTEPWSSTFGHAHIIDCSGGMLAGAADPRALIAATSGC